VSRWRSLSTSLVSIMSELSPGPRTSRRLAFSLGRASSESDSFPSWSGTSTGSATIPGVGSLTKRVHDNPWSVRYESSSVGWSPEFRRWFEGYMRGAPELLLRRLDTAAVRAADNERLYGGVRRALEVLSGAIEAAREELQRSLTLVPSSQLKRAGRRS
jgi:hypothetical protein